MSINGINGLTEITCSRASSTARRVNNRYICRDLRKTGGAQRNYGLYHLIRHSSCQTSIAVSVLGKLCNIVHSACHYAFLIDTIFILIIRWFIYSSRVLSCACSRVKRAGALNHTCQGSRSVYSRMQGFRYGFWTPNRGCIRRTVAEVPDSI